MPKKRNKYLAIIANHFTLIIILIIAGYYAFSFVIQTNFRQVVPGKIYRSAQPSSSDINKWSKKYDIKTIINLRAKKPEDFESEKQIAEQLGITFIPIYLSAKRLVTREELLQLIEAIENAELPVLLHCHSGIDRAGAASVLAAIAIGNIEYDIAKRQSFVPAGPWKRKDFSIKRADYIHDYAHISDTLKLYEGYCESMNIDKNDWQQFVLWANNLPDVKDLDIKYESSYSYFPFLYKDKKFFPVFKLLKDSYIPFTIQIIIIILWVFLIRYCKFRNCI